MFGSLQWKSTDKWIDAYAGKFEDLKDLKEIPVLWDRFIEFLVPLFRSGSSLCSLETPTTKGEIKLRRA